MDPVRVGLKRAYWGSLRISRRDFTLLKLTPARFDILYGLTDDGWPDGRSLFQSQLRRMVGVNRATMSEIMIAMEAKGIIARRRSEYDRRQLDVWLTKYGKELFRAAFRKFVVTGEPWSHYAPEVAHQWGGPTTLEADRWAYFLDHMQPLHTILSALRIVFRDFAWLNYPWFTGEH
jgi:DNA-binding MarR family transcriptional regulator